MGSDALKWDFCKKGVAARNRGGGGGDAGGDALDGDGKCLLLHDMLDPGKLSQLATLNLGGNALASVPNEFGDLAALTVAPSQHPAGCNPK